MPISTLHRIEVAFDKAEALSFSEAMIQILDAVGEFGGQKLRPLSGTTEEFFRTGQLPLGASVRMGNDYLNSLSPDSASWIRLEPEEESRTSFISISTVLSYSPENFRTQWQISKRIVDAACTHLPVSYALANAKDIDDEHSSALPDVTVLDRQTMLQYIAPLTFVSRNWISPSLETCLGNCFADDQKTELPHGVRIDFSSADTKQQVASIAKCVEKKSEGEITLLRPKVLVTKG